MKVTTLILTIACAAGLSACCCQSQSAPKLHPMPKNCCNNTQDLQQTPPTEPIKVMGDKGK